MLIVIFVGLALLTALAIFLRRRHRRNRDRSKGRFNDGITNRSMTNAPVAAGLYDQGSGRATPASVAGHASRSDNRLASASNLSRGRERDMPQAAQAPEYMDSMRGARGTTPMGEVEKGRFLTKGKRKVNVNEDEIRPMH